MTADSPAPSWTLLSSHGQVLACVARDPAIRLRDVAAAIGLTERAVQKIVADLEAEGLLSRSRSGRRNRYRMHVGRWVAVPAGPPCGLKALLEVLTPPAPSA